MTGIETRTEEDHARLRDHLLARETELQTLPTRTNAKRLGDLLAADFHEFGRSGRSYRFDDILASLPYETTVMPTAIEDFAINRVSETVALATYRGLRFDAHGHASHANRSSIWRRDPDRDWRMVFHQGTPVPDSV
jgi:hypothetical protein